MCQTELAHGCWNNGRLPEWVGRHLILTVLQNHLKATRLSRCWYKRAGRYLPRYDEDETDLSKCCGALHSCCIGYASTLQFGWKALSCWNKHSWILLFVGASQKTLSITATGSYNNDVSITIEPSGLAPYRIIIKEPNVETIATVTEFPFTREGMHPNSEYPIQATAQDGQYSGAITFISWASGMWLQTPMWSN